MSIHLAVKLRLPDDDGRPGHGLERADRQALDDLHRLPDGTKVVIDVGDRDVWPPTAHLICAHADRLVVQVEGHPRAAMAWFNAVGDHPVELLPVVLNTRPPCAGCGTTLTACPCLAPQVTS